MKKGFLIVLLLIKSFSLMAHLGSIVGKVSNSATRQPLVGATISISEIQKGTITDETGFFKINNLPAAVYRVEISLVGYRSYYQLVMVKEDEAITVDFLLDEVTIDLSEVKVAAENPRHQRLISFIDIRTRAINNSQEVLRIIPGLVIGQHAGGGKAEQIFYVDLILTTGQTLT